MSHDTRKIRRSINVRYPRTMFADSEFRCRLHSGGLTFVVKTYGAFECGREKWKCKRSKRDGTS